MDIDVELLRSVGGKVLQADITEKMLLIGFIWKMIEKKVAKHFNKLEESVAVLAVAVSDAAKSLGSRLDSAEVRIAELEQSRTSNTRQGGLQ